MKGVIGEVFPELTEIGFTDSRVCFPSSLVQNVLTDRYSSYVGTRTALTTK